MKKKFFALLMLFAILFALSCISVLAEEPAVIYPDSQSGAYSCTYDSAQPGRTYLVTVVKGLYDNAAIPDIEDADIVYFNSFTADNDGRVEITYVPSSYADSTVIISSGHLSAPEVVCHAKAGEAIDVVDFEIILAKDTYTVSGNGYPVYVRYSIKAVDSFGFPTTLPSDAVRSFDNYEGDRMRFLENANTIELSDNLEPGQYTFSISCCGITEKATFTVEREPSVASELDLKVNGEKNSAYYVECFNGIGETTFDPEYLLFEANVLDQYGDIMSDTYTYEYAEIDSNGIPGPVQKLDASSSSYKLYPLGTAGPLDILEYVVYVTSNTYPSLKEQVRVTIVGRSEYEGAADSLYLEYINAQMYVLKMQNGEIVIDVSSDNVPASKQWITQALADRLVAQTTSAKQLLEQHEQTLRIRLIQPSEILKELSKKAHMRL